MSDTSWNILGVVIITMCVIIIACATKKSSTPTALDVYRGVPIDDFISLVKTMREAQKVYAETFPTGYGCYAPTDIEREVDEYLEKLEGES